MTNKDKIKQLAIRFGLLGCLGLFVGLAFAIFIESANSSSDGFLLFQKSISELGYYGHSPSALVLNGGLFFGSLCIALANLFALQVTNGWFKYPFWLSFSASFIALGATGLFPLNVYHLHLHGLSYLFIFVCCSCIAFMAYALQIGWRQVKVPLLLSIMCLMLNLSVFILPYAGTSAPLITTTYMDIIASSATLAPKPELWWQALVQWSSDITLILWVLSLLSWIKKS
ncbi:MULTISPECIES: hypothetical protein [Pseudomonadati]|uniref:DUF998 domain-containing protein n=1 Tax=Shewanella aestuarii TaxID=1028752 RepID=A0ABT0L1B8_9GAMM|nr:hypothetical protein [Shewanella aestuarii]MCL1117260.1 hypothetical protein [Shewanella aestuarii]